VCRFWVAGDGCKCAGVDDLQFGFDFLALCNGSRGFLVDSGGGLVHGGSGSVAGWLVVGLWGGLPRWW
jgi:hypothetical protein